MRAQLMVLVVAVSACGKVHNLTDAGNGSGSGADSSTQIDAPGPDADPHGPITVLVNQQSGPATPQPGVPVVFVNPGGTIVAEMPTGSDGKATATVLPGATVTAVYDAGTANVRLETVRDVAPGDTIVIGPTSAGGSGGGSGTFTVNVADDPAGGLFYEVFGPCGSSTGTSPGSGAPTPVSLFMSDGCKLDTMDLIAIARNSDKTAIGWQEKKGVPYVTSGSTDMNGAWQPLQSVTASYTNPPATLGQINVTESVPDMNGLQASGYAAGTDTRTITFNNMPTPSTVFFETNFYNTQQGGQQQMYEVADGTKTTYSVDLATALLPWVPFPTFDPGTATITASAGGGDVLNVQVQFSRTINSALVTFTWDVWSPPADSITLPPMPTDLAQCTPVAGDSVNNASTNLYGADAITSWAQIRGQLFGAFDAYYAGRSTIANGRFVWSYPTGLGFTGPRARR
jgi:hypothetical protein